MAGREHQGRHCGVHDDVTVLARQRVQWEAWKQESARPPCVKSYVAPGVYPWARVLCRANDPADVYSRPVAQLQWPRWQVAFGLWLLVVVREGICMCVSVCMWMSGGTWGFGGVCVCGVHNGCVGGFVCMLICVFWL